MRVSKRTFLQLGVAAAWAWPAMGEVKQNDFDAAADVLRKASESGQVRAAALYVRQGSFEFTRTIGDCKSPQDIFLIASISKPMTAAAMMTLYDQGKFDLDDRVARFIPEFKGEHREEVTIRQLLTHVSGLPDQLPENRSLRSNHAELAEFVERAIRTPLLFRPGAKYSYSSMGTLLAAEIAQRITRRPFHEFMQETVFEPLKMKHSALGLGELEFGDTMQCQVEDAAPESGAGDPAAKNWDWNSQYWRKLGSPWGGVHASAPDIAKFLSEFLYRPGTVLRPKTAELMIQNHNRTALTPRGLGFAVGKNAGSPGCSAQTFGHGGATGTLAWADPKSDTICIVLTTLPSTAVRPHPRKLTSDRIARAAAD